MTNDEHRRAMQDDADEDMERLGSLLHEAMQVAKRLEGREVAMGYLGCSSEQIRLLRDAAEDAYTTRKGKVGGSRPAPRKAAHS